MRQVVLMTPAVTTKGSAPTHQQHPVPRHARREKPPVPRPSSSRDGSGPAREPETGPWRGLQVPRLRVIPRPAGSSAQRRCHLCGDLLLHPHLWPDAPTASPRLAALASCPRVLHVLLCARFVGHTAPRLLVARLRSARPLRCPRCRRGSSSAPFCLAWRWVPLAASFRRRPAAPPRAVAIATQAPPPRLLVTPAPGLSLRS